MKKEFLKFNNEKWILCEKKNSMKKLFPKHGFPTTKKKTFPKMFLTNFFSKNYNRCFLKNLFPKIWFPRKAFLPKIPFLKNKMVTMKDVFPKHPNTNENFKQKIFIPKKKKKSPPKIITFRNQNLSSSYVGIILIKQHSVEIM